MTEKIKTLSLIKLKPVISFTVNCTTESGEKKELEIGYHLYPQIVDKIKEIVKQTAKTEIPETYLELEPMNLECLRCGICCQFYGHVPLRESEVLKIAEFLGISLEEAKEKYTDPINTNWQGDGLCLKRIVKETGGTRCIFLTQDETGQYMCPIYPARPKVCQSLRPGGVETCHPLWKIKKQTFKEIHLYPFHAEVFIKNDTVLNLPYSKAPEVLSAVKDLVNELKNIDLREIMEQQEKELLQRCIQCGHCCIRNVYIIVTEKDINYLAKFLQISREEFTEKYTCFVPSWESGIYHLKKIDNDLNRPNWCIFLAKAKDKHQYYCSAYPARPQVCRDYRPGFHAQCFAKKPQAVQWEFI